MSGITNGGPAFPVKSDTIDLRRALTGQYLQAPGLMMRDWFAGQALASLNASNFATYVDLAHDAFKIADTMMTFSSAQPDPLSDAASDLLAALQCLYAMVNGECPSLLNEDSGGSPHLDMQIKAAIARATGSAVAP